MSTTNQSANKPATVNNPEPATDTILTSTQQNVTDARASRSTRAVNSYGVTIMRGGNVLGSGFIDSVVNAYTNIVYQPVAFGLFVLSFLIFVSHHLPVQHNDPFFMVTKRVLILRSQLEDESSTIGTFYTLIGGIFDWLSTYKYFIGSICAYWFPYFAKPSNRNGSYSTVLLALSYFSRYDAIHVLLLSNLYFLFTQLRSPLHKFGIAFVAIVVVLVGSDYLNLLTDVDSLNKNYGIQPKTFSNVGSQPEVNSSVPTTPKTTKGRAGA